MAQFKLGSRVKVKGKEFKISQSQKPDKQRKACRNGDCVHYGDPDMPEFPATKRGDNFCARSFGLGKKFDVLGDTSSANFWSRKDLWNCDGKKSRK